ncbi:hypothetical protein MMC31_006316 [Peltigera leucophlebia]|nr:hypothetical protein [Peltigera leucophlebia]
MSSELLSENYCANPCTSTVFRVCAISPQFSNGRPYGLDASGSIMADNPSWPTTRRIAQSHLLWEKVNTPFISVFNLYEKALNWAEMLERKGHAQLRIVVIDTYAVPQGKLWNAHQIATDLGFEDRRIPFHKHEYLFYGSIERERILAVLPAKGPQIHVSVHLGTLTLPQLCVEAIGSPNIDAVKAYLREEIRRRCGHRDEVLLQQTILALCTVRLDYHREQVFGALY